MIGLVMSGSFTAFWKEDVKLVPMIHGDDSCQEVTEVTGISYAIGAGGLIMQMVIIGAGLLTLNWDPTIKRMELLPAREVI